MEMIQYQKGKFYTLPVKGVIREGGDAYFQVTANEKDYLIRMFDFQAEDPEVCQRTELQCRVKDVHGDNILFVQNFARMFGDRYREGEPYPFIVVNKVMTQADGRFIYNVRDLRGVPFKLTTTPDVFLRPLEKIHCKVRRSSPDLLVLEYASEPRRQSGTCMTPEEFLSKNGTDADSARLLKHCFSKLDVFAEAREALRRNDGKWIVNAILAVPDLWAAPTLRYERTLRLVEEYIRLSLYLLEESRLLLSFPDAERENYQEWIADKIRKTEIYSEVLDMAVSDRLENEIDSIVRKIGNAGFIYRPEHKIGLLIAIFSLRTDLLEERIDDILSILESTNWKRSNVDFRKAFRVLMSYYIDINRKKIERMALVNDADSNRLLTRMIRATAYLILLTDEASADLPLYRSLLYHYLSYVRHNDTLGNLRRGVVPSETLLDRAFQALMSADAGGPGLDWKTDMKQTEVLAYRLSIPRSEQTLLSSRSLETDSVRFSVSNGTITIAPTVSSEHEHNVVPSGVMPWHDIQIYLPTSEKHPIQRNAPISKWKEWWGAIDRALFEKRELPVVKQRKFIPEVKQNVFIRVLSRHEENPYRYFCRIEDEMYYGEGWLDVYGKGATIGLFRYDPYFDLGSFYYEGKPLLIEARVSAVKDPNQENPVFMFDSMGLIDQFVRANCDHGDETDCKIIYHDKENQVYLAISEHGYGVFIPDTTPDMEYDVEDTVRVMLTDLSKANRIQAEVLGPALKEVNVKDAAENLLLSYCDAETFEESGEQLAKEAMSLSDDQFEPDHISQLIAILDHKALMERDRAGAYGYLSTARLLAKMIEDSETVRYLDQRLRILAILDDFGKNGKVDNDEFEALSAANEDLIQTHPLLQEKLCQIKIVSSIGHQERNPYLWELAGIYPGSHLIGRLTRLALSYNISDGLQLTAYRQEILERIRQLLDITIVVPKIYSFGEEDQVREFKTSIVFPPDQSSIPDRETQTFNILKVIAGMANAYGGTLYLGVDDSGTAKGLKEDLTHFQNSKDKFRNYLRNQIRVALGGVLNALITEEYPEAGEKWVYALKIRPSKNPVALVRDNESMYFLREGASTYLYASEDTLRDVMRQRDFGAYGIEPSDVIEIKPDSGETSAPAVAEIGASEKEASDESLRDAASLTAPEEEKEESIATGTLRRNIVDSWEDGYGTETCGYLRFFEDGTWTRLYDVAWQDGLLTLAVADSERSGSLMLVYADGEIQRVGMDSLLNTRADARNKMRYDRRPVFICPATEKDALLVIYRDGKGKHVMRLDDVSRFKDGKMTEAGNPYPDSGLQEIVTCEIVPSVHHESLKPLHNMLANSNFRTDHHYGSAQRDTLEALGITLP